MERIPCRFPVNRENYFETGSQQTASTATNTLYLAVVIKIILGFRYCNPPIDPHQYAISPLFLRLAPSDNCLITDMIEMLISGIPLPQH